MSQGNRRWPRACRSAEIQKRLGRKQVSEKLIREVPVAYVVFDVLYAGGELDARQAAPDRGALLDQIFDRACFPGTHETQSRHSSHRRDNSLFEPVVEDQPHPARFCARPSMRADSAEHLEQVLRASY